MPEAEINASPRHRTAIPEGDSAIPEGDSGIPEGDSAMSVGDFAMSVGDSAMPEGGHRPSHRPIHYRGRVAFRLTQTPGGSWVILMGKRRRVVLCYAKIPMDASGGDGGV